MHKVILAALVLAACADTLPPGFSTGPGVTTAPASTGTNSTSRSTSTTTGSDDDSAGPASASGGSTGLLRDVGTAEDFGPVQPEGCKGKVDLLFLISSYGTMKTEQAQLVASFPGFVSTIEDKLADFDVHIMVANPIGKWAGWPCEQDCNDDPQSCAEYGYQCNVYPKLITPCDNTLGAGLTFNAGGYAANRQCELFGGNRYIISGQPDMNDALECIAKVGMSGGVPPLGDALIAALQHKINAEDGCNKGFLREEALLVVVFISDIYDEKSTSWPYQQYDAIIAAKKDPNAVVMLGVISQPLEEGEPEIPGCSFESDENDKGKIHDLIEKFPNRAYGDICADDYTPFFNEAADLIGEVCGKFVPQ